MDNEQGASAIADQALVPTGSNPQAVSTKGFDPSREEQTIEAVMAAVALAFNPNGNREVAAVDVVNACAAITAFIDAADTLPTRTLAQWKEDIGNLRMALGGNK